MTSRFTIKFLFIQTLISLSAVVSLSAQDKPGAGIIEISGLKSLFDNAGMNGAILIFDPQKNVYLGYNSAIWDSGYLPASTFKIPNTLIGLESGVIDTSTVFKWDGAKRNLPQWEKDLTLKEAFLVSCVPCYQELARKIGPDRMHDYLSKIGYADFEIDQDNIDRFWLEGSAKITPRQQASFLQRLYEENLPLKTSTMKIMKSIMVVETTPEYSLSGKTGWAIRNGNNYGWFVGWIETGGKVYFLATLIEPKDRGKIPEDFTQARKIITIEALRQTGILSK